MSITWAKMYRVERWDGIAGMWRLVDSTNSIDNAKKFIALQAGEWRILERRYVEIWSNSHE